MRKICILKFIYNTMGFYKKKTLDGVWLYFLFFLLPIDIEENIGNTKIFSLYRFLQLLCRCVCVSSLYIPIY